MNDFAVFILTHGRPKNVKTHQTLRRYGYTGKIYLIVDNEDKTIADYQQLYGDDVIIFDKRAIAERFDECDNFHDRRSVFYARNASFGIAEQLGVKTFLQLDDDYHDFCYKFDSNLVFKEQHVKNLDRLFEVVTAFYWSIPALTVALGQTGDFIGGHAGTAGKQLKMKRKAMNAFFCSPLRPFSFVGRVNEDVNTYVLEGNRGGLFLTIFNAAINQAETQAQSGGMTEMYKDSGTYWKSFYTVMLAPSCVQVGEMGHTHRRIHHRIHWPTAVPCIVSESLRRLEN